MSLLLKKLLNEFICLYEIKLCEALLATFLMFLYGLVMCVPCVVSGLVSDAFHLTFGCGLLSFSLFAMAASRQNPDRTYTYGYELCNLFYI